MKRILFWLKGYVRASIPTENSERFINMLLNHQINACRFQVKNDRCYFQIERKHYLLLRPLVKKTGICPRTHNKCGGYYVLTGLFRHSGLILGIVCFFLSIYLLSLFLWDIEFDGNTTHTDEQLLQFVNEQGIGFASRTDRINCALLEDKIRQQYSDIGWVSVEIRGSRMLIRVRETEFTEKNSISPEEKSHIVATQNGIVSGIITRTGTPLVQEGDTVKKGDIIISGYVNTLNEYNETVRSVPVYADGDVLIKADVSYYDGIPLLYQTKTMTGKQKQGFVLSVFNKKIISYIPSIPYDRYDIINTSVTWKISKNLYLPISHNTISCMEFMENEVRPSNARLSELCYQRYLESMEQYLKNGYRLISDQVDLQICDDVCTLQGTVTLEGPFWERVRLSQEELEGDMAE